jgi:RNA polymerase sigma factor (sigma-70 family)
MDKAELSRLVAEHQPMVYSIAWAVLRDHHAAEDVSQEVFMSAIHALEDLRDAGRVRAWLGTMARNRAIDHHRSRRRRDDLAARKAAEPDRGAAPDLDRLLEGLDDDQRHVLLLKYVHGMSYREIAAVLQTSPGAVAQLLLRLRRKALDLLREGSHEM